MCTVATGCNGLLDMVFEGGAQRLQMQMPVHPSELLLGLDHARRAPPQSHLPIAPVLYVAGMITADFDHGFDGVG